MPFYGKNNKIWWEREEKCFKNQFTKYPLYWRVGNKQEHDS